MRSQIKWWSLILITIAISAVLGFVEQGKGVNGYARWNYYSWF